MKQQPISILHTLAQHYAFDASDFMERFDALWETLTNKTGRIKTFVDLLMAFECALKAHIALMGDTDQPEAAYRTIRSAGHRISTLAKAAKLLENRSLYDEIALRLDSFSVFIRYSLDAYHAFFPWYIDQSDARLNYSMTIGNEAWVRDTRALLPQLIHPVYDMVNGEVPGDIAMIIEHDRKMMEFMSISMRGNNR
jgi:hypothetical protein